MAAVAAFGVGEMGQEGLQGSSWVDGISLVLDLGLNVFVKNH